MVIVSVYLQMDAFSVLLFVHLKTQNEEKTNVLKKATKAMQVKNKIYP